MLRAVLIFAALFAATCHADERPRIAIIIDDVGLAQAVVGLVAWTVEVSAISLASDCSPSCPSMSTTNTPDASPVATSASR